MSARIEPSDVLQFVPTIGTYIADVIEGRESLLRVKLRQEDAMVGAVERIRVSII